MIQKNGSAQHNAAFALYGLADNEVKIYLDNIKTEFGMWLWIEMARPRVLEFLYLTSPSLIEACDFYCYIKTESEF